MWINVSVDEQRCVKQNFNILWAKIQRIENKTVKASKLRKVVEVIKRILRFVLPGKRVSMNNYSQIKLTMYIIIYINNMLICNFQNNHGKNRSRVYNIPVVEKDSSIT